MKVLDLFCGRGGWSKPFVEDGMSGRRGYPGYLGLPWEVALEGCPRDRWPGIPRVRHSLRLASMCGVLADQAQLQVVPRGRQHSTRPRPRERVRPGSQRSKSPRSVYGKCDPTMLLVSNGAYLVVQTFKERPEKPLGNFKVPMCDDFHFVRSMEKEFAKLSYADRATMRAEIPYPIARFIADSVKAATAQKSQEGP